MTKLKLQEIKEETNIRVISDMIASKPYLSKEFTFIPCQMGYFRDMKLLGIYTACFHPNEMSDLAFENLEKFIKSHRSQLINFGDLDLNNLKSPNFYDWLLKQMYFGMRKIKKIIKS